MYYSPWNAVPFALREAAASSAYCVSMRPTPAFFFAVAIAIAGCARNVGDAKGRHPWTKPGLLRVAVSQEPMTLNPLLASTTVEVFIDRLMFEPLLSADARGNPVPMLATTVPTEANGGVSRDGLTVRYALRRNARWSDGVPVSAKDVIWSWHAIMNPLNNVVSRHGYDAIKSIDAPNPNTLVVHLTRPFAPFVNTFFAESDQPYDVVPAHVLAGYRDINHVPFNGRPAVSDGPFLYQGWRRGDQVRLIANHSFFFGAPALRSIDIQFIPNEDSAINLLRTHTIDYIYQPSIQTYTELRSLSGTKLEWVNVNGFEGLAFNLAHPVLANVLVRRAIAGALDKNLLTQQLTHGQSSVASEDLPNWMWAFDPSVKSVPFDPAAATTQLARAGWVAGADGMVRKQGRPLQLLLATDTETTTHRAESLLIQAALRHIGIAVTVKYYPQNILYAPQAMGGIQHGGKFDLLLYPWYAGIDPDDSSQLACANMPPYGYNDSRYCSAPMDAAQKAALTQYDRQSRKRAYSRIERLLSIDNPMVFFWWQRQQEAISDDFHGFAPNPVVESWNAWQWSI